MSFSILGKVSVDSSGFYRGMAGIKAGAAPLGRQIGGQMKNAIMGAIGAGAIVSVIKRTLKRAFDIRTGASKLGVDSELFQTLETLSNQTGASIEDMVDSMNSGTESGLAFADAVGKLNTQLRDNNDILSKEQVDNLASMQDELDRLSAKIAPAVGGAASLFSKIIDGGKKALTLAAAGGMTAYGMVTGDKSLTQAGRELSYETVNGTGEQTTSEKNKVLENAKTFATEIAKQSRLTSKDGGKTSEKESILDSRMQLSSDTQVGRYFGAASGVRTVRDTQLELINRTLNDINQKIASFK